jgi:hypothetical protein
MGHIGHPIGREAGAGQADPDDSVIQVAISGWFFGLAGCRLRGSAGPYWGADSFQGTAAQ